MAGLALPLVGLFLASLADPGWTSSISSRTMALIGVCLGSGAPPGHPVRIIARMFVSIWLSLPLRDLTAVSLRLA